MNAKEKIAALEAALAHLRRENLALRETLIRAGLSANHQRVLERDIQLRKQNAA